MYKSRWLHKCGKVVELQNGTIKDLDSNCKCWFCKETLKESEMKQVPIEKVSQKTGSN